VKKGSRQKKGEVATESPESLDVHAGKKKERGGIGKLGGGSRSSCLTAQNQKARKNTEGKVGQDRPRIEHEKGERDTIPVRKFIQHNPMEAK